MTAPVSIVEVAPLVADRVQPFTGTRPYVATGSMRDTGEIISEDVTYEDRPTRADLEIRAGDVCTARMESTAKTRFFEADDEELILSTGFAVLRPKPLELESRYLFHYIRSDYFQVAKNRLCSGAVQSAITNAKFSAIQIPLPPLAEQRRIAAILDAADALRTKRRQAIAKLDTLTQAIFIDMFGDPVRNERGWPVARLGDVCFKIQIGPFGSLLHKSDYIWDGIPIVNPMHIIDSEIVPKSSQTISRQKHETLAPYWLEEGDVVMGRRGEMGRCAVVTGREAGYLCGSGSLFFRPNTSIVTASYIATALSSAEGKRKLEKSAQGVTMPNLNSDIVENLSIGIPSEAAQLAFAVAIEHVSQISAVVDGQLAKLNNLFGSLQQRAFRGEL